jgi:hypothetical protein
LRPPESFPEKCNAQVGFSRSERRIGKCRGAARAANMQLSCRTGAREPGTFRHLSDGARGAPKCSWFALGPDLFRLSFDSRPVCCSRTPCYRKTRDPRQGLMRIERGTRRLGLGGRVE